MPRTYKTRRGPAAKDDLSKRTQIRLYAENLARLDALVAAGYGANRSEVIRRSIAETAKWTLPRR